MPSEEVVEETPIVVDELSDEENEALINSFMSEDESEEEAPGEEEQEVPKESEEEVPKESEEEVPGESEEEVGSVSEVAGIDMDAIHKELFVDGVKASGGIRKVRDAKHLKTLVQLGLGANTNNERIKPYLRQFRSLEEAGVDLSDNDNLNFVVDVMNGNKDAIKELVKRHKIDEDTLQSWADGDEEEQPAYLPNNHVISDKRLELQETLESIKHSDMYDKTANVLANLDDDDRVFISETPIMVKHINNDMELGIYEKGMDEVGYRMDSGTLPKQSKLSAYVEVMRDQETYNRFLKEVADSKPRSEDNTKAVIERKKRATPTSTNKQTATPKERSQSSHSKETIRSMSNDEFEEFFKTLGID